jgi:hypothetical protein
MENSTLKRNMKEYHKKRYLKNKEKIKKQSKKWALENKDKVRTCARERYRKWKEDIVKVFGNGQCLHCGYNKHVGSLDFHHIDPNDKEKRVVPENSRIISNKLVSGEICKCVILCRNCHQELHAGLWKLNISYGKDSASGGLTTLHN